MTGGLRGSACAYVLRWRLLYKYCLELDFLSKREWVYKTALRLTLHEFHCSSVLPHHLHEACVLTGFFCYPHGTVKYVLWAGTSELGAEVA